MPETHISGEQGAEGGLGCGQMHAKAGVLRNESRDEHEACVCELLLERNVYVGTKCADHSPLDSRFLGCEVRELHSAQNLQVGAGDLREHVPPRRALPWHNVDLTGTAASSSKLMAARAHLHTQTLPGKPSGELYESRAEISEEEEETAKTQGRGARASSGLHTEKARVVGVVGGEHQGRPGLEKALLGWFRAEDSHRKFVLWGPGGTGKSALAFNFAAGQAEQGGSLLLVFALSATNMVPGYARLLDEMTGQNNIGPSLAHDEAQRRTHELLRSPDWSGRWLAILDDMPAPSDPEMQAAGLGTMLAEFPWGHGWTIITTRSRGWVKDDENSREVSAAAERRTCDHCGSLTEQKCGKCRQVYYCSIECQKVAWSKHKHECVAVRSVADVMGLKVASFGENEACSWLQQRVRRWRGHNVLDVVRSVGCLPLALALVSAFARIHKTETPADYLAELQRIGRTGKSKRSTSNADYPPTFPDVIKLSLDRILRQSNKDHAGGAGRALRQLSLLSSEAIPLEFLGKEERAAVPLLEEHALVTVDGRGLGAMHAMTQEVVRKQFTERTERGAVAAAVVAALAGKLVRFDHNKPAAHFIGRLYATHARAVAGNVLSWGLLPTHGLGQGTEAAKRGLWASLGLMSTKAGHFFLHVSGQSQLASHLYELSLQCALLCFGPDHANSATASSNLGNVLYMEGKNKDALVSHRKALEIRLKVLGPAHPDVVSSFNGLGLVFHKHGEHEEAIAAHKKALEIGRKVLGPEHPSVAASYNNLGNVYESQGKVKEAMAAHKKALEIRLKVLGPEQADVAMSYKNLGNVYQSQGKYEKALLYLRSALDIELRRLGDLHPDVAACKRKISLVLEAIGKTSEAKTMSAEVAAACCTLSRSDHQPKKPSEKLAEV